MDRQSFARYVQQALVRLHDLAYLETHPLAQLLGESPDATSGESLQRVLTESIERLRPAPNVAQTSPAWRTFRQLWLRHVEGLSLEESARQLLLSRRQAQRDHAQALEAITAILWARYCRKRAASASSVSRSLSAEDAATTHKGATGPSEESSVSDEAHLGIEEELLRLSLTSPRGPTVLAEVLQDCLATAANLLRTREVTFRVLLPQYMAPVAVNRVPLRQIMLNVLAYLSDVSAGRAIDVAATDTLSGLEISFTVDRSDDVLTTVSQASAPSSEATSSLDLATRLAVMQGGSLRTSASGDLALTLPVAVIHTILVIDDNPHLGRLFHRFLIGQPYRVVQATDGAMALDLAQRLRPNLITLDVLMPTEDGWEILRDLKADPATKNIPVVVCSVLPEKALALSLGVVDFLSKPVTAERLLATLRQWVPDR